MIQFANPELLWLLALLPVYLIVRGRRGGRPSVRFSSAEVARDVARETRGRFGRWLPLLRVPAVALLILAMARPQIGHATTRVQASGVDLMLAVDVSGSMEALDLQDASGAPASRIEVVKDVVASFVEARPNDRVGLIAFAGGPYLVSPLTLDHEWLQDNLHRLETGLIEDGTAVGSALATSVERLREQDSESKVVVLLTDGVNNAGTIAPTLAAELARSMGITVHTIGVGVEGQAPMPVRGEDGVTRMVMADVDVDEETLQAIADTTGGQFFRATDTDSLERVYAEIDRMERTDRTIERFEHHEERFALFAVPGIALLGLELLLAALWLRRVP
ncbi:MAG: VWA domain-containing protein [Myxococcota bacterium]|nr:VWA domain-containing protein [Myxococcota bacterium]